MPELHLTNQQLRALVRVTEGHETGVTLEVPEALGPSYIRVTLVDADGNEGESQTWTHAGVPPRAEGVPPEWKDDD
jgi:hypothetical protein